MIMQIVNYIYIYIYIAKQTSATSVNSVTSQTSVTSMTSPRPSCVQSCDGLEDGDYHSCHSCVMYASCQEGILYSRMCGGGKLWDDEARECTKMSTTC